MQIAFLRGWGDSWTIEVKIFYLDLNLKTDL